MATAAMRAAAACRSGRGRRRLGIAAAIVVAAALAACADAENTAAPTRTAPAAFDTGQATCASEADPRLGRAISPHAIDPALMDRAIRLRTNQARCAAGLAPVSADPRLTEAALAQARRMAASGVVAPARPEDTSATLRTRYFLAEVGAYAQRGENLTRIPLEHPGVLRVRRGPPPNCDFAALAGPAGLAPTYRSVANRLVEAWMSTEGFRANMLAPDWTHSGAAVAIRPVAGSCGDVYAAQSFKAL